MPSALKQTPIFILYSCPFSAKKEAMIKTFDTYKEIPEGAKNAIVAIGNFDGVHQGHRALLSYVVEKAKRENKIAAILSFSPHPRRFFQPDSEPFRLMKTEQRARLFNELGIDIFFNITFDRDFSKLTAERFIDDVLVEGLGVSEIVVGEDFRFGHERQGTVQMLHEEGLKKRFSVTVFDPVRDKHNYVYSSTIIREKIKSGEMEEAQKLLGSSWEIESVVIHGDKRGRTIGYPTANMTLEDYVRPKFGVYAVQVLIEGESAWRNGVANIGIRPMFETPIPLCETYIFDFSSEIYDKIIRVRPVAFIRKELRFDTLEALISQIKQDEEKAKDILLQSTKTVL